jgi:NAD-dependent DNA ligase
MINEIIEKIKLANDAYRSGPEIISDAEYDLLIEELTALDPDNDLLNKVGHDIKDDSRKVKLPITMASMNKCKTLEEIFDWCKRKGIDTKQNFVITPKYDGLSFCVNEETLQSSTRGDGVYGQKSDDHYKLIGNKLYDVDTINFSYGEVMMKKSTFLEKYSMDFANPRNLVSGILNSKDATEPLKDLLYIKYGGVIKKEYQNDFSKKSEILQHLNDRQEVKVPFEVTDLEGISEEKLSSLFKEWSEDFEIDGLIIEVDDLELQNSLGRETSTNNPSFARAYKSPDFEQTAETEIIGITWEISKQGLLKPVLHIRPVKLDGVTISNVSGNNARFVKDMGLGISSKVLVKRSGFVIPIIYRVIEKVEFQYPQLQDERGEIDYMWNENGVELVTLYETEDQKFKKIVAFFEILEVDNVGEGVISQLWDHGYKTIHDILKLTPDVLSELEGFGKRKSVIVYNSIQKRIKDIPLSKLQHATGFFTGLGEKKLILLEHFETKPTIEEIVKIEGFAKKSAESYLEGLDKFYEFISDLPVTILKTEKVEKLSDSMEGMVFVFTGVRDKSAEESILKMGGKIGSSVSKLTTHLVCKDPNSGSSKLEKAISLGVKVISIEELHELFLNQSV